ncbi:hypothetical protein SAMN02745131_03917 [Flavisolibacter ginsengisoli DSM 18119]|uniref:Uncharacterized protein n=1 Tax=Flavisolibacter ginsengisoli DSM 18119 TaxID=1121884 RepID=A0A1M5FRC9_9BACT|nr:hypothetical protein SAMN02745131_03917 [Flavisolibacter ginsengisoli DSM 18119]
MYDVSGYVRCNIGSELLRIPSFIIIHGPGTPGPYYLIIDMYDLIFTVNNSYLLFNQKPRFICPIPVNFDTLTEWVSFV